MMRPKKLAFAIILLVLVTSCTSEGSEPSQTMTHSLSPPTANVAPSETPRLAATPTLTALPTQLPIHATPPYDKVPEQIDDGWQTGSLVDVGIDPTWIRKMLDSIYQVDRSGETPTLPDREPEYQHIHSILIVKDGRLVFEEYFYFYSRYSSHEVASVTKSFTSLLVGLAIEQGYVQSVDEKILTYFSEYLPLEQPDEQVENITIEDLLTMRSGWECDDWDPASRTYYEKEHSLGWPAAVETILNFPMETRPGSHFSYCTSGTIVLNALLTKATGMELSSFAREYLLQPLGIQTVTWEHWGGWADIGGILLMRSRDMAKIGLLVLQNGNWNGEQIVPEDWIRLSTQEHVSLDPGQSSWDKSYGYLWRLAEVRIFGSRVEAVYALGGWQQVIAIFPGLNMVVVVNGGHHQDTAGQPFEIMERFILPAVLGY
jgi:CubicO group peptidase (beta-lactamase class C family)